MQEALVVGHVRREAHRRTDGQVVVAGENDHPLAAGDDREDRGVLADAPEARLSGEVVARQREEGDEREQENED